MKSVRIDFSKGTNSRVDPRLLGQGALLVADNTDTRSGVLKPARAPEFQWEIPPIADEPVTRIFEFRGRWHTSTAWRYYAAQYVGIQERVFFVEPNGIPQKMIDGVQARLGIVPPCGIPTVNHADSLIPYNIGAVEGPQGALAAGGYSYRIGLRTRLGRLQPSSSIILNLVKRADGNNGSVKLTWNATTIKNLAEQAGIEDLAGNSDITAVVIYGRTVGQERVMMELSPSASEFIDNGSYNPSGPTASGYDSKTPLHYFYTFERDVSGHIDESGPSVLSAVVDSSQARMITFDPEDGALADLNIKHRNLYRIGDVSIPALVAKIPIKKADDTPVLQFLDATPMDALGDGPDSEYDDSDGMHVVFAPAPVGLKAPTPHLGMLFGIYGSTVRCTPANRPDAWPSGYVWPMPYPPLALVSFAGALIILGPDALYRLDGSTPGSMSLTRMPIEDGCIAPFSVQATPAGLLYLSARGIMRYQGGMQVEPLTEGRLDPRALIAPSTAKVDWNFWWLPTKYGQPFAAQTRDYPTADETNTAPALADTRVIDGPIEEIRSFCFENRYYLYYVGPDHGANTMFCVDLGEPGMPTTTLGLRPLDVHVTSMEQCYMLLPDYKTSGAEWQTFRDAQGKVEQALATDCPAIAARQLARWGKGSERVPWYIRTGPMAQGNPVDRKRYRYLEFHGSGTVNVRVYVDGRIAASATVTTTETPNQPRRLNLPRSTWGYSMDLEATGDAELFAMELKFNPMPSPEG